MNLQRPRCTETGLRSGQLGDVDENSRRPRTDTLVLGVSAWLYDCY